MRISDWSSDVCSSDLHAGHRFLEVGVDRGINWNDCVLVLDEIAEVRILLVADRRFQAARLLGALHHLADLLKRHRQTPGQFLSRRFAAELVKDLAAGADPLVDRLDNVDWNAEYRPAGG